MSEDNALAGGESLATTATEKPADVSPETEAKIDTAAQDGGEGQSEPDKKSESDDAKAKPRSRAQERIEELARDRRNLRRQLSRANQEIGKLRAERPPSEADFADPTDYTAVKVSRVTREQDLERRTASLVEEMDELKVKRQEAWDERVAEVRDRMPDFEQVFDPTVPISDVMADLIVESESGPELAYYLGKHRSEASRIANMPPIEAAREMGRLESRIAPPAARRVSSAPKPVSTVSGKAAQSVAPAPSQLANNMDDYARYWESREGLRKG